MVLFPGFQIVDAAGPIGAFEIALRFAPGAYELRTVARAAGLIPSSSGVPMPAQAIGRANADTYIVVGGNGTREALQDETLIRAIANAPSRARRVASVCSGAFLLAQAGLLAGKRATTHWRRAAQFAQMFPDVRVEADCIYVKDGAIWTSAGVTAGIDLALAMIAEDLGEDVAANVAREMVLASDMKFSTKAARSAALSFSGMRSTLTATGSLSTWCRAR